MLRFQMALIGALFVAIPGADLLAGPVSGSIYYTRYSGAPNVKNVAFSFNGSTLTLGAPSVVGTTIGADGIVGNPQNSNLLIVGGQGGHINTINKTTGVAIPYASPVSVFHLEVPNSTTLLGSGIPGALARHTINPDGSLTAGTTIALSGSDSFVTQVITTPSGYFYTTSGAGGFGSFGTLAFNTGNVVTATAATTTRLFSGLPAAHGGTYDPFTNSVIVVGDGHITQFSLAGALISDLPVSGVTLDQGTVDGSGHLFVASNTGHLFFMDYAGSGVVSNAGNFTSIQFLDSFLDDIAPLIGSGTTNPNAVPEPSSLAILASGALAMLVVARRRKRA